MTELARTDEAPWTSNDSTFGARLALVRQYRGWGNVKEAAVACGIPVESWRTWERDSVMPQGRHYFDICAKIAGASGCDYGWLVDRRPCGASQPTVAKASLKVAAFNPNPFRSAGGRAALAVVRPE